MNNQKMRVGYYAFYPTLLEPAPGPWGGWEIFGGHPVDAWRTILSWLKNMGVDYVVAVISPKFRDNIYHDWPFHYVCDMDKYPEARMFPPEVVERNRDITNRIVEIANSMGIDMYFAHFNFYAPRGFINKHPRILEKYKTSRGMGGASHDSCNYMNTLLGNICWKEVEYQEFMKYCWAEFFRAIPGAKGLLITPGEHVHCTCPACNGTSKDAQIRKSKRVEMIMDFIRCFIEEMNMLNRESLVRTWTIQDYEGKLPEPTVWLPKYHVFDCFDAGMDPNSETVKDKTGGKVPVHYMFTQNGENASLLLWFKPEYWKSIAQNLRAKNADGAIIMHNIDWGMNGMTHPVSTLNLEGFLHYIQRPDESGNQAWENRIAEMFGEGVEEQILIALDLLASFPMNVTKVIFLGGEGYTFGTSQPCDEEFAPDPWGVLCRNWTPPDWARGDITRLKDYWNYLGEHPFNGFDELSAIAGERGERCPLKVMQDVKRNIDAAISILKKVEPDVKDEARGILDSLAVNACLAKEHTTMLIESIKTALLIRSAREAGDSQATVRLAGAALETHTQALNALKRQIGWMNSLPHDMIDFRNWFRFLPGGWNSYQSVMFTPLGLMEMENKNLREWIDKLGDGTDSSQVDEPSLPSLSAAKLPPVKKDFDEVWINK